MIRILKTSLVMTLAAVLACASGGGKQGTVPTPMAGKGKIKITRLDDLPPRTFEFTGSVVELVQSEDDFATLAHGVREDVERILADYDIQDAATVRRLEATLLALDLLEGHDERVAERVERMRELEDKPAAKLMTGLTALSLVEARRGMGAAASVEDLAPVFREELTRRVGALPWDTVQDVVESAKGQAEMMHKSLLFGILEAQVQPVVDKTGGMSRDVAQQMVSFRFALKLMGPLKDDLIYAYQSAIDANRGEAKGDIWKARSVVLSPDEDLTPVVVGIWDTGVDVDLFPGHVYENSAERLDGSDTDGNGFVDDVHGIAHDLHHNRVPELIYPLEDAAGRLPEMQANIKGYFDLRAAIDSPEASAVKMKMATLTPEEVKQFFEDLARYAIYAHGTHVAGIAVEGNPAARIMVARLTADYRMIGDPPTVEDAIQAVREFKDTVAYFKSHGVRVVNMSWVIQLSEIGSDLEQHGIGEDAEDRAAKAREIFEILSKGLYEALSGAPEILFVGGAGNFDNDVSFDEIIPPAFDLSNLLIAGAVDQAGDPAGFTSFGERVQIYSNGFEVESYVPGGERMEFSGTSMSAPNVTNLAAKLFAINPSLTPVEVKKLVLKGGDHAGSDETLLLVNPRRTVDLLGS